MAKKPVKKKAAKVLKKPAPKAAKPSKPVKKPVPKAAAKKAAPKPVAKKVVVQAKKPAVLAKAVAKKVKEVKGQKVKKPVEPKVAKPIPEKVAKKGNKVKVKVEEVVEVVLAPLEEEEVVEEIVITDAEGRRYCRVKDCDQISTVDGYCRYHYLLYWKKIQVRKKILTEGKLERYVEELTARYPDKFLDVLRKDLRSDKEFLAAIQELEIDESANESEFEDEAANYIEEVRGMAEPGARDEEKF